MKAWGRRRPCGEWVRLDSGSKRSGEARGRERRALTRGAKRQRQRAKLGARAGSGHLGRQLGRACARWSWPLERWLGLDCWAEQLGCEAGLVFCFSFPFPFSDLISFPSFEFKFGLKFEFQIDVI
jgi:hypothetical protein